MGWPGSWLGKLEDIMKTKFIVTGRSSFAVALVNTALPVHNSTVLISFTDLWKEIFIYCVILIH
jgi:hypothetical protein